MDDYYATIASRGLRTRRIRREPQPGVRPAPHVSPGRVHRHRPRPRRQPLLRLLARSLLRVRHAQARRRPTCGRSSWRTGSASASVAPWRPRRACSWGPSSWSRAWARCVARWVPRRRSGRSCAQYEDAGVDQLIFVSQAGRNRHEDICESLELFAPRSCPSSTNAPRRSRRTRRASRPGARRRPGPARPAGVPTRRLRLPRHAPVLTRRAAPGCGRGCGRGRPRHRVREPCGPVGARSRSAREQVVPRVPWARPRRRQARPAGIRRGRSPRGTQARPRSIEWGR